MKIVVVIALAMLLSCRTQHVVVLGPPCGAQTSDILVLGQVHHPGSVATSALSIKQALQNAGGFTVLAYYMTLRRKTCAGMASMRISVRKLPGLMLQPGDTLYVASSD
jgi:protein involved in polysaccharide export with SLBB domain